MPSGPSTSIGGSQSASAALLRSNSGILAQGGPQGAYSSLSSVRPQYDMNLVGNAQNISSGLSQSLGSGGSNSGLSHSGSFQHGGLDTGPEFDALSIAANDIAFAPPAASFPQLNSGNPGSSSQVQNQHTLNSSGNQVLPDQLQSQLQQLERQKFHHGQQLLQQFSQQQLHQLHPQQQPYQATQGGSGGVGVNDQNCPQQQLQLSQQNQVGRGIPPVKIQPNRLDQQMFLQQQQQRQQFLHMSRQSSHATAAQLNLLQQQRLLQLQQQKQQQQLLKATQQQPQLQPQFQQPNLPAKLVYEPGMCAQRLTQYMIQQKHRPDGNNIEFWQKFVAEFFAPNAKKRWCISQYGKNRQTNSPFPQDVWHCEICNRRPGRGFETTFEVLPRLCKIKYDSGTLEELLYFDMPHEYQDAAGQIVLNFSKAVQESVFEQLRVVRDGQLRIVFSPDLKICSWLFCARHHEELIPRRSIIPQVSQLGVVAQKYHAAAQNPSNISMQELKNNCNTFVSSARQLAKALEVPLVNDLGYTKRFVRCLQISEVVNCMKDLIDYSRETEKGPIECLAEFPRRSSRSSGMHNQLEEEQHLQQQNTRQRMNNDDYALRGSATQVSACNGVPSVSNGHSITSTSTSATAIVGLLCQNSMNSRHENQMNNPNSPFSATPGQIPSAGSSTTPPSTQLNPSSPFSCLTPSSSHNPTPLSQTVLTAEATANHITSENSPTNILFQKSSESNEADPNEHLSSVERIIQEIMSSSQFNSAGSMISVGSVGNNVKNGSGMTQINHSSIGGGDSTMGSRINSNSSVGAAGFGNFDGGIGVSATANRIRATMGNNSMTSSVEVGMPSMPQDVTMNNKQQDMKSLNGVGGGLNDFNNLRFN